MIRLVFTLAFFPLLLCAQSPITLGNTNMPGSGDTLRYTNVSVSSIGNYAQTGTNFTWNFASATSLTEGLRSFKSALSTPYALFFASFTGFAEKMPDLPAIGTFSFSDYYNFYRKPNNNPNAYIADGVGMSLNNVPLPSFYTDKDELYFFPMSYPKYDSSTFRFSTPNSTLIPIRYSRTGYRVTKVDGWGTITTPYGTEACLRLVTTEYGMDSIKNNIIPIPIGIPRALRSYQWLTLNSKIPYFEVSGGLVAGMFTPTTARYRGYKKELPNPVGIDALQVNPEFSAFPSPASQVLHVQGLLSGGQLQILDIGGKCVQNILLEEGTLNMDLNVQDLEPGVYFVQWSGSAGTKQVRFVKN